MPTYDEVLALARQLPSPERTRLARTLAPVGLPTVATPSGSGPAPHSVAWLKSERGHAVLATDLSAEEAAQAVGADALLGMWADLAARTR